MKGLFLIVDGIDGSGKGTAIDGIKEYYEKQGKKVFDLREYWKEVNEIPEAEKLKEYDVIISSEPTHAEIGNIIRTEIVRTNHRTYSALSTAQAFALDREILHKKLIIPALKEGKIILQERGVMTSLVYQPIQSERLTLQEILHLPGNKVALENAPDLLIITKIKPEAVIGRLNHRTKKDVAIFENLFFQRKIAERYESEWLKKLFENHGSTVIYLDTNQPKTPEDTKQDAIKVWEEFISR